MPSVPNSSFEDFNEVERAILEDKQVLASYLFSHLAPDAQDKCTERFRYIGIITEGKSMPGKDTKQLPYIKDCIDGNHQALAQSVSDYFIKIDSKNDPKLQLSHCRTIVYCLLENKHYRIAIALCEHIRTKLAHNPTFRINNFLDGKLSKLVDSIPCFFEGCKEWILCKIPSSFFSQLQEFTSCIPVLSAINHDAADLSTIYETTASVIGTHDSNAIRDHVNLDILMIRALKCSDSRKKDQWLNFINCNFTKISTYAPHFILVSELLKEDRNAYPFINTLLRELFSKYNNMSVYYALSCVRMHLYALELNYRYDLPSQIRLLEDLSCIEWKDVYFLGYDVLKIADFFHSISLPVPDGPLQLITTLLPTDRPDFSFLSSWNQAMPPYGSALTEYYRIPYNGLAEFLTVFIEKFTSEIHPRELKHISESFDHFHSSLINSTCTQEVKDKGMSMLLMAHWLNNTTSPQKETDKCDHDKGIVREWIDQLNDNELQKLFELCYTHCTDQSEPQKSVIKNYATYISEKMMEKNYNCINPEQLKFCIIQAWENLLQKSSQEDMMTISSRQHGKHHPRFLTLLSDNFQYSCESLVKSGCTQEVKDEGMSMLLMAHWLEGKIEPEKAVSGSTNPYRHDQQIMNEWIKNNIDNHALHKLFQLCYANSTEQSNQPKSLIAKYAKSICQQLLEKYDGIISQKQLEFCINKGYPTQLASLGKGLEKGINVHVHAYKNYRNLAGEGITDREVKNYINCIDQYTLMIHVHRQTNAVTVFNALKSLNPSLNIERQKLIATCLVKKFGLFNSIVHIFRAPWIIFAAIIEVVKEKLIVSYNKYVSKKPTTGSPAHQTVLSEALTGNPTPGQGDTRQVPVGSQARNRSLT